MSDYESDYAYNDYDSEDSDEDYPDNAVVIDNGTKNMRVGHTGRDLPSYTFKTTVARLSNEDRKKRNCGYLRRCDAENAISGDIISVIDTYIPQKLCFAEQTAESQDTDINIIRLSKDSFKIGMIRRQFGIIH